LNADDEQHHILDDALLVASMKASAEAKRTKPIGWEAEDMMDVDKEAPGTPSTLSSHTVGLSLENMNPQLKQLKVPLQK
jgi:hypothetical protein